MFEIKYKLRGNSKHEYILAKNNQEFQIDKYKLKLIVENNNPIIEINGNPKELQFGELADFHDFQMAINSEAEQINTTIYKVANNVPKIQIQQIIIEKTIEAEKERVTTETKLNGGLFKKIKSMLID